MFFYTTGVSECNAKIGTEHLLCDQLGREYGSDAILCGQREFTLKVERYQHHTLNINKRRNLSQPNRNSRKYTEKGIFLSLWSS